VYFRWLPPGPLFPLIAYSVAARTDTDSGLTHMVRPLAAAASAAALSVLVGALIGRERRRQQPDTSVALPPRRPRGGIDGARYGVSAGLAGALATITGFDHAYWAMLSAVVPFMAAGRAPQVLRAVHRVVGTLLGLLVTALILSAVRPHGLTPILVVIILQAGAELLILRHYGMALVLITPLALVMAQTVDLNLSRCC
jgi:uncharacterized membrane protein YccC